MILSKEDKDLIQHWLSGCKRIEKFNDTCKECEFKIECNNIISKLEKTKPLLAKKDKHLILLWMLSCEDLLVPKGGCKTCLLFKKCQVLRLRLFKKKDI